MSSEVMLASDLGMPRECSKLLENEPAIYIWQEPLNKGIKSPCLRGVSAEPEVLTCTCRQTYKLLCVRNRVYSDSGENISRRRLA